MNFIGLKQSTRSFEANNGPHSGRYVESTKLSEFLRNANEVEFRTNAMLTSHKPSTD